MEIDKKYTQYAQDVLSGQIVACKWIKLSCKRYLALLEDDRFEFKSEKVDQVIQFCQMFRHIKGITAGNRFILSDWLVWIVCQLYGLYWKDTDKRLFNRCILMIPRKSGKTFFAAALSLFELLCNKDMPEVLNVANSRDQAKIFYDMAVGLCRQLDHKSKYTRIYKKQIDAIKNGGKLLSLSSDSTTADGYSCSFGVVDELGTGTSDDAMYQALILSLGARKNSLVMVISTAGSTKTAFYQMIQTSKSILEGKATQDNMLPILYTLDEDDDYRDPAVWKKAAPNLGISVPLSKYEEYVASALTSNTDFVNVMVKLMNVFQSSLNIWIDPADIDAVSQPIGWDKFTGPDTIVFGGLDLASVRDMTAFSAICYNSTDDKYYIKSLCWLPEDSLDKSPNVALYRNWADHGYLNLTSGNFCDHLNVLASMVGLMNDGVLFSTVAYDRYQSGLLPVLAATKGLNLLAIANNIASITVPTKTLELLILERRIVIDDSPVTKWCFGNVKIISDTHDNIMPSKTTANGKIDIVMSMIMSLGICMASGQLQFKE